MRHEVELETETGSRLGPGIALSLAGGALLVLLAFTRGDRITDAPTPSPVGFGTLEASGAAGRALPMAVWYPAQGSEGPRLQVADYITLAPDSAAARAGLTQALEAKGAPRGEIDRWLGTWVGARRNVPHATVPSPLVLIAGGNDASAGDQAMLAEALAAQGYVVAAAAFPTSNGIAPMLGEADVVRVAEAQADDLGAMVRALGRWPNVDTMHVGVVGHSFGARGGLLFAMRNPRVRALVSLDGGIGSATGQAAMRLAPSFAPRKRVAPILHVYETLDAWMRPDQGLLEGLDSTTVWLAQTREMHHHHFTALGAVPDANPLVQQALGYTMGTHAEYLAVQGLTVGFLNATLRGGSFAGGAQGGGLVVKALARESGR